MSILLFRVSLFLKNPNPAREERDFARLLFVAGHFIEVFVDTPLEVCEARNPQGLYKKARSGLIPNMVAGMGYLLAGKVDGMMLASLLSGSIPAVILSSLLAGRISADWVKRALAIVLIAIGIKTLLG